MEKKIIRWYKNMLGYKDVPKVFKEYLRTASESDIVREYERYRKDFDLNETRQSIDKVTKFRYFRKKSVLPNNSKYISHLYAGNEEWIETEKHKAVRMKNNIFSSYKEVLEYQVKSFCRK